MSQRVTLKQAVDIAKAIRLQQKAELNGEEEIEMAKRKRVQSPHKEVDVYDLISYVVIGMVGAYLLAVVAFAIKEFVVPAFIKGLLQ